MAMTPPFRNIRGNREVAWSEIKTKISEFRARIKSVEPLLEDIRFDTAQEYVDSCGQFLLSTNADNRLAGVIGFTEIGGSFYILSRDLFKFYLVEEDEVVRTKIIECITEVSKNHWELIPPEEKDSVRASLGNSLRDESWLVVASALTGFGELKFEDNLPILSAYLFEDKNPELRISAAHAISNAGGDRSLNDLTFAFREESDVNVATSIMSAISLLAINNEEDKGLRNAVENFLLDQLKHKDERIRSGAKASLKGMAEFLL